MIYLWSRPTEPVSNISQGHGKCSPKCLLYLKSNKIIAIFFLHIVQPQLLSQLNVTVKLRYRHKLCVLACIHTSRSLTKQCVSAGCTPPGHVQVTKQFIISAKKIRHRRRTTAEEEKIMKTKWVTIMISATTAIEWMVMTAVAVLNTLQGGREPSCSHDVSGVLPHCRMQGACHMSILPSGQVYGKLPQVALSGIICPRRGIIVLATLHNGFANMTIFANIKFHQQ